MDKDTAFKHFLMIVSGFLLVYFLPLWQALIGIVILAFLFAEKKKR